MSNLPPPPPGFVLQGEPPAPPPGFMLQTPPSVAMGRKLTPSEGDTFAEDALDVGKSLGSGLVTGTEAVIGLPGSAINAGDEGMGMLMDAIRGMFGETNNEPEVALKIPTLCASTSPSPPA